jgi:hypothetical protein
MRGREENTSTVLLRDACVGTCLLGYCLAMLWANPSQYYSLVILTCNVDHGRWQRTNQASAPSTEFLKENVIADNANSNDRTWLCQNKSVIGCRCDVNHEGRTGKSTVLHLFLQKLNFQWEILYKGTVQVVMLLNGILEVPGSNLCRKTILNVIFLGPFKQIQA